MYLCNLVYVFGYPCLFICVLFFMYLGTSIHEFECLCICVLVFMNYFIRFYVLVYSCLFFGVFVIIYLCSRVYVVVYLVLIFMNLCDHVYVCVYSCLYSSTNTCTNHQLGQTKAAICIPSSRHHVYWE